MSEKKDRYPNGFNKTQEKSRRVRKMNELKEKGISNDKRRVKS